jgi:hypothetical protein
VLATDTPGLMHWWRSRLAMMQPRIAERSCETWDAGAPSAMPGLSLPRLLPGERNLRNKRISH